MSGDWIELALKACALSTAPMIAAGIGAWMRALRRARPEAPDPGGCVACGEPDVAWVADGVYVCGGCGYEGGPGHADWLRSERRRRLAELPEAQRRERVRAALEEARVLARGADAVLQRLQRSLRASEVTDGSSREIRPWEADLLSATGDLARAFAQLSLAADGLQRGAPAPPRLSPELWQNQLGEYDLVCVREDLASARSGAHQLLDAVERLGCLVAG